jgi:glycosyltransferase involved in cell wall biosynthesis
MVNNEFRTPKVLIVLGESAYGGATYLVLSWVRFLVQASTSVTLLSTDPATVSYARQIEGVRVVDSIPIPRDVSPLRLISAFLKMVAFLVSERFDIVHTHTSTPGFIGRIASFVSRTPVRLHTAHGWPVTPATNRLAISIYTLLEFLAGLVSTKVICVGEATAMQGRSSWIVPEKKVVVIANGIDVKQFTNTRAAGTRFNVRRELGVDGKCILIGNTGRLAVQKDNTTLIKSTALLAELLADKPFKVVVAGSGPESAKLQRLASSTGVLEHIEFLGFYRDIPALLSALDIFVSPSLWEGLSISILEAMATGLPIVATNIAPNMELIEHEVSGLLVATKSPIQVAEAINRFVMNPEFAERCGSAAQARVMDHYTIDRTHQETWDLYMKLMRDRG